MARLEIQQVDFGLVNVCQWLQGLLLATWTRSQEPLLGTGLKLTKELRPSVTDSDSSRF
jgi:hypothetical protein